ncbi:hypothetical protein [Halococcus sp. PRR34]|uniref:hypothetical protein n=1 Tax=Halococcus sp. PRR34 TaxID=3020830 RepID=UPI002360205C|nr:hypothetical protein [Halococcus sp. PRR34]
MVQDDGSTDEDDSDSVEYAGLEDLIPSEEEQQAAISRVTFDWCETVREAGDRYREGESIRVLAVELEVPMEKARRAVKTYYLVFGEAPIDTVRGTIFEDGRRYFRGGLDVGELDTETRTEAEEHVRTFVGRTLLDNELDAVDIEEPVPEMEVPMIQDMDAVVGSQVERMLESVKEGMSISGAFVGNQFLSQRLGSQIANGWQQTVGEMRKQNVRGFQQAVRATGIGKSASTPALAATAGISSVVASSAMAGFEPSMFQTMGQPALSGLQEAIQTMPAMYSPTVQQMMAGVSQSVVEQISYEMQTLSVVPVMRMSDLLEQYQLQPFAPLVQQANNMSDVLAGAGTMGAVAVRPESLQGFEKPEKPWSPAQPEPEPGVPDTDRDWWLTDRVHAQSSDILFVVVSTAETGSIGFFSWLYPEQQLLVLGTGLTGWTVVQVAMLLALNSD